MAFQPTKEQSDAIQVKGTALISAAAGSGKTAVLTTRVVSRMLDPKNLIPADRLLVVTFTNAAAAEMRGRIEALLSEALEKDPKNPRIHRQLLLMQSANITTIDAFCINLVRDHFDRLGVSPDFKIAAGETLSAVSDRVLEDIIEEEFKEQSPVFLNLLEALGSDFGEEKLVSAILKITDYSASMPFPKKWRRDCVLDYLNCTDICTGKWGRVLFDYIRKEAAGCAETLRLAKNMFAFSAELSSAYYSVLDSGIKSLAEIEEAAKAFDWDRVRLLTGAFGFPRAGRLKTGESDMEKYKNTFSAIKKKVEKRVAKLYDRLPTEKKEQEEIIQKSAVIIEKLIDLCDVYEDRLFAALTKKNLLSFADAEHLALSLFIEEKGGEITECAGAEELRERFDEILVDEYQDTNKLQDSLFQAISKDGKNLFMVGDVKQSIYRFRHADPGGFLNKKNRFTLNLEDTDTPSKIILGKNFRSRKGICDYINFCFGSLMNTETGEMDYSEEEMLVPAAQFPPVDFPAADLALIQYDPDKHGRVEAEASYIAEYIQEAVKGRFLLSDMGRNSLRQPRYSDFAILLRSFSGNADIYAKILRKAGIPVSANVGSLLSSPEVMVLLSFLKVISNPTRDIPLLSVMVSPIFGFTYDELAVIRSGSKNTNFYTALLKSKEEGNGKVAGFLDQIRQYREQAAVNPVDKFILMLLEETGYLNIVLAMEDGDRKRRNLLMIADMVSDFAEDETMTLSEYLAKLERADKSGSLKASPPSGSDNDAVKIMSIHASKGLQFPVCILANCSGKMNKMDTTESLLISEEMGIGLKLQDDAARRRISTLAREAVSVSVGKASVAEELRLLYVAMTRAEEKLLITVCEREYESKETMISTGIGIGSYGEPIIAPSAILSAGSYTDWILLASSLHPKCGGLLGNETVIPPPSEGNFLNAYFCTPSEVSDISENKESNREFSPELLEDITKRFSYRYPYAALNLIAAKTGVSRLVEQHSEVDYSFTALPSFLSKTGLTSAQRGTATHKFMQFADFAEAEENVGREIDRLVALKFFAPEEAKGIYADRVERFFKSNIYNRIKASSNVMREVRFIDEIPACRFIEGLPDEVKNEPVVVQGVADCIFEENGQLVVLDYKTDKISDLKELAERYGEQLKIYAEAAEKNFGKPVKECIIYSFSKNTDIII